MFEKAGFENWEFGAEAAAAANANWSCICCWIRLKDELGDELLFKSEESCSIGVEEEFELKLELLLLLLVLTKGFIRNCCCCCWDCCWKARADKIWLGFAVDQLGDEGCDDIDDDDDDDDEEEDDEDERTDELTESLAVWTLLFFSLLLNVDCFDFDFEEFLYEDADEEEDDDDEEEDDDDDLSDCDWLLAVVLLEVLDEWHLWLDLSKWAFKLW